MTVIFPTAGDVHVDDEAGVASAGAGNTFFEDSWKKIWQDALPTSRGSWLITPFLSSQSFPTGGLTLTTDKGIAVVDGFMIDFTGQSGDITFSLTDDTHNYLILGLTYTSGNITGYEWITDTTATLRQNSICIGQAIVAGGSIIKWHPVSYPEGWRVATGSYDTTAPPQTKPVVLGFQPTRVQTGTSDTLETYGFSIESTGETGTYEALLFDHTT